MVRIVKKISKTNKDYYICEECDMAYEVKDIAKECENYCKKYKSCNLELIKHSVKI